MKARLNRQLFTQRSFDSGAIGALESVVHQFSRPGSYVAEVRRNGDVRGSYTFVVAEQGNVQLDVDLTTVGGDEGGCDCHSSEEKNTLVTNGYVLFHASSGSGYSVLVGAVGEKGAEFNSEQLRDGDLFALCLLEPTRYALSDRLTTSTGEIDVTFSESDAKRIRNLETVYVDVGPDGFRPNRLDVVSTQGIVFRVKGKARVLIEKSQPEKSQPKDRPAQRPRGSRKGVSRTKRQRRS
jgi:hypothetical protein